MNSTPVVFAILTTMMASSAHSQSKTSIDLRKTLSPSHPCRSFARPVQFFSEKVLVVLSGEEGYCYRDVSKLQLNLISTDGRVLAQRKWPATDPGLVIASQRLVLATLDGLEVENEQLTPIQVVGLPPARFVPTIFVHKEGTVSVKTETGELVYGGVPLRLIERQEPVKIGGPWSGYQFADGQTVVQVGGSLVLRTVSGASTTVGSLNWAIPPCSGGYVNCQAYEAGSFFQVSSGKGRRVLVASNGSRFPITDAAGLFPYFRVEVFDINTGKSLYRKEYVTLTGERSACISPDGDLLAITDGRTITVVRLP